MEKLGVYGQVLNNDLIHVQTNLYTNFYLKDDLRMGFPFNKMKRCRD